MLNQKNNYDSKSLDIRLINADGKPLNTNTQTEIAVSKIPNLSISTNSSTDYVSLCAIIFSFAIAILSFWVTIYVIKRNGKDQIKIANDNSLDLQKISYDNRSIEIQTWISTSRQNWINNLRDSVAEFISTGTHLTNLAKKMKLEQEELAKAGAPHKEQLESYSKNRSVFDNTQRDLIKHELKIKLLLNETENDSKLLITAMANYRNATFDDKTKLPDFPALKTSLDSIVNSTRSILSNEWRRAKEFNGLNN
ncbi:hypothetical protein [Burkholderia vietnamiensis]|uniref:hypothetical protein n=1 Tax=Burkholderia vietnamiensis TaxID=60552 RepID=UPI001CF23E62|nr:hypothetical protein [Burkholderia vietnamiensis]MCA8231724.1 hypothetical protein [Burkholderia vietnamiensis]